MATATSDPRLSPVRGWVSSHHGTSFVVALVLRLVCAGLLIWVGAVHLDIWMAGYKHIHILGPLFLADAVGGFALGALVLIWPRPLAGLLGAGYMASTLAGLIYSINFALFGFRESSGASFVFESIVLESVGTAVLLVFAAVLWSAFGRSLVRGVHRR